MAGVHSSVSFLTHVRFDLSRSCPPPLPFPPARPSVRSPLSYIPGYDTCKSWSEDANCADPSKSVKIQKCTISYDVRMQLQQEQSQRQEGTGAAEVAIATPCPTARPRGVWRALSAQRSHNFPVLPVFYVPVFDATERAGRAHACLIQSPPPLPAPLNSHCHPLPPLIHTLPPSSLDPPLTILPCLPVMPFQHSPPACASAPFSTSGCSAALSSSPVGPCAPSPLPSAQPCPAPPPPSATFPTRGSFKSQRVCAPPLLSILPSPPLPLLSIVFCSFFLVLFLFFCCALASSS